MSSNSEKMRQRWQDEEYRAKMLDALNRGRETYTRDKRLVAEAIHRCWRTRKLNEQRAQTVSG